MRAAKNLQAILDRQENANRQVEAQREVNPYLTHLVVGSCVVGFAAVVALAWVHRGSNLK